MKVYPGTAANSKRRKNSASARDAGGSFIHYLTTLTVIGSTVGICGGFFMLYMSLVQQVRNTDQLIRETDRKIAETERDLQTLNNEYAALANFPYISRKIREFNLPLVQVHPSQIRNRSMAVLTPLQASQMPYNTYNAATSVARNDSVSSRRTY